MMRLLFYVSTTYSDIFSVDLLFPIFVGVLFCKRLILNGFVHISFFATAVNHLEMKLGMKSYIVGVKIASVWCITQGKQVGIQNGFRIVKYYKKNRKKMDLMLFEFSANTI